MRLSKLFARFSAGAAACLFAVVAHAQSFAGKPIRILVGYAPGGGADLISRVYGEKLQELLGTSVVVENKPGAFELFAAQPVVAAAPDGHTLWLGTTGALTMGPGVRTNVPYDVLKSFTHVGKIGEVEAVFIIKKDIPANTWSEFIAYAKQNPGKLNYASAGVGSGNHLLTEYLMGLTNITMTHIPYKGDADVMRELAGGGADFGIPTVATGSPFVKDGRVKALVVTGTQRAKALPNVPSLAEDGGVERSQVLRHLCDLRAARSGRHATGRDECVERSAEEDLRHARRDSEARDGQRAGLLVVAVGPEAVPREGSGQVEGSRQEGQGRMRQPAAVSAAVTEELNVDYGLAGRVVVISGGTSGIGMATAAAAARSGAHVAVIGTNQERMANAVAQLREAVGGQAKVLGALADVRDRAALDQAAAAVAAQLGPVWGVVAAAGSRPSRAVGAAEAPMS